MMEENETNATAGELTPALAYGMSSTLRDSGLLGKVSSLNHEDKACLIRFIRQTDDSSLDQWEDLDDDLCPYTMEELNARIDEAEEEIDRGGGESFDEMMDSFKQQLLWLK